MNRQGLQWFRVLVPGVLGAVLAGSLLLPGYDPARGWASIESWRSAPALVVLIIGVAYRGSGLQNLLHEYAWRGTAGTNIKSRLLAFLPESDIGPRCRAWLEGRDDLIHVFYRLVDSDPSLANKAQGVYENGAYLGAATDIFVFGVLGTAMHFILWLAADEPRAVYWLCGWGLAAALAAGYVPFGTRRHLRLSNEQLDFIGINHQEDVQARVRRLVAQCPEHSKPE